MRDGPYRWLVVAAWLAIAAIAYATLTRIGFVYGIYFKMAPLLMHPDVKTYAHFVHVLAFMILGALFILAYTGRTVFVCLLVGGAAICLEALQMLTPDRHGTVIDAAEKVAGGAIGIFLPKVLDLWRKRRAE